MNDDDERYIVPFQNEYEAQRRQTELEERLAAALKELDRQRGRVVALEDRVREYDRPGYQYIMLPSYGAPVPIEDVNRFAKDGWRLVAASCGTDATWIVIMERAPSDFEPSR